MASRYGKITSPAFFHVSFNDSYRFQIKDEIKAARIEATKAYTQYVEEPKTSQRRGGFDLEME